MKTVNRHIVPVAAGVAFLAAFGFFQFAYPYHLMRREQLDLFLYDWDFIRQTYTGAGWLARFVADFLDQFFHLPVVGPLIIALALTAIGTVTYKISHKFFGRWPSLAIAALVYAWSFLRETENLFCTRYTLVLLGYLALILLALQFKKVWMKPVAAVVLLAIGIWALGAPSHQYYGKLWGTPSVSYDRMIGLDVETSRENWDKVMKLSEKDLYMSEASYCFNLAHAMKGDLGKVLLNHSQNGAEGLFIRVSTLNSPFTNGLAGEAWFQLGDMTLAEQSAMVALQASPRHTGARYLVRLARENLIAGGYGAAQKYLGMLSKTLFYGKWARKMMPGHQDAATQASLEEARARLAGTDLVHESRMPRTVLTGLLQANPDNAPARDYLLCYDLLLYNLDQFVEDFGNANTEDHIYQEALLIWLSQQDALTDENLAKYGIPTSAISKMERFFRNPALYKNTYWYYYMKAMNEE